jgi:hypothetical protein
LFASNNSRGGECNRYRTVTARLNPEFNLKVALKYASNGLPVFPCNHDKSPRTDHGFHDATADSFLIRRWWERKPESLIGLRTGRESGLFVVDVDDGLAGENSLKALERENFPLPKTYTVSTPGNPEKGKRPGQHLYFRYPDGVERIKSTAGVLAEHLDVRGDDGYVIAPPSGGYEVLHNDQMAEAPSWLVELVKDSPEATGPTLTTSKLPTRGDALPDVIWYGERNRGLYRYGCSFRARGYDETQIYKALIQVDRQRCDPPINDEKELRKIAKSAAKHEAGKAFPGASDEVKAALDGVRAAWWDEKWKGMGGYSSRDVEHALIFLASLHGEMILAGVRVSVDIRTLALMAGVGIATVSRSITRLSTMGHVRRDNGFRTAGEAGAFVLLVDSIDPRAQVEHSNHFLSTLVTKETRVACVPPVRAPSKVPQTEIIPSTPSSFRLRWTASRYGRKCLGKTCGAVVDHLEEAGGILTVEELLEKMGKNPSRLRDFLRRAIEPLEADGVVERSGNTLSLTSDWLSALNESRERNLEIERHNRDLLRYETQRAAYRYRHEEDEREADFQSDECEVFNRRATEDEIPSREAADEAEPLPLEDLEKIEPEEPAEIPDLQTSNQQPTAGVV